MIFGANGQSLIGGIEAGALRHRPTLQNAYPSKPNNKAVVCSADVVPIKFSNLWANYVAGDPYRDPRKTKIKGRTGILFFENYWTRSGETQARASGSHIDLWDGSRLTVSGFADGVATIGRYLGRDSLFQGTEYGYSIISGLQVLARLTMMR